MADMNKISWPGWETEKLIGRGSFGEVYEIRRNVFGELEKAALKVISIPHYKEEIEEMHEEGYDDESITTAFQDRMKSILAEYSLMRKLNGCANIVNCDDIRYVQHDDGFGWDIFIKMELLTPLMKTLPSQIPEETVVKVAKDICNALVVCKEYDIVHRDIKPQNIFVSKYGDYKLGDFGIAKTVEKTTGGTKIGTYKYMAPEVYNNQPYGTSADIYSLGLVLYWLLNERRLPFVPLPPERPTARADHLALERRYQGEQLPPPAHGSEQLKRIVLKACSFDPKDRYASAFDMLQEMNRDLGRYTEPENYYHMVIAEDEANQGCQKNLFVDGEMLTVVVPKGTSDGAILCIQNIGGNDVFYGIKRNIYVKILVCSGVSTIKDWERTCIISTREAKRGCKKKILSTHKTNDATVRVKKIINIPAGCTEGQVVDSVKVYVHDFNCKNVDLENLPVEVLKEYANGTSGRIKGIIISFFVWAVLGMITSIPLALIGYVANVVIVLIKGKKKQRRINEAKRILELKTSYALPML